MPRAPLARLGGHSIRLPFRLTPTRLALLGIVLLAAALRLANSAAIGQANTYYTAAVESMLQSWHNFFFVAAEPGGSVSIDKPPVGLWLQAISAYVLGVNGFAVVLPQILAGLASVVLLFHLVRRSFGDAAGLLAALALAVTPVAVAVERNNTPDATLIFTLLLAAWAFIKATETSRLRYLLVGAALVGVGFNIKMMQALLPLPAFYALYLFGARQRWWRKVVHLGVTTLVLIPIALSWAVAVDLTPAGQRPYVGSSGTNSALHLIIGYNGLQRLTGGMGGGAARADGTPASASQAAPADGTGSQSAPPAFAAGDGAGGPPAGGTSGAGGMFGTGEAGLLRLFQSGLAAQVSWLLPFGLIALAAMGAGILRRHASAAVQHAAILWGGWLLTCAAFFSVAGFFHQYYLAMMAPPLAAVVGIGALYLWRMRAARPAWATLLLLGAAGATLAFQAYAVAMYQSLAWWVALPVGLGVGGLALLLYSLRRDRQRLARLAFTLTLAALLVVPGIWSGLTTAYATQALPQAYAGKSGAGMGMPGRFAQSSDRPQDGAMPGGGMPGGGQALNQSLLAYLQANTQDTTYLLVVPSSQVGAQYVLATGRPVLYAGGFNGSDTVIDGDGLARLVASGEVRYVLWGGGGGPGGPGAGSSSITSYLQSACTVVSDASLGGTAGSAQSGPGAGFGGQSTLYQCGA